MLDDELERTKPLVVRIDGAGEDESLVQSDLVSSIPACALSLPLTREIMTRNVLKLHRECSPVAIK